MDALLDNNVPRSVTHLLQDQGWDAVEVRDVLASDAPDADVLAYARATARVLVTHDRGLARRARLARHPHIWLRTRETQDLDCLVAVLVEVERALNEGAVDLRLTAGGLSAS